MGRVEDFEMPSPKRPRVEIQEPDTFQHPAMPIDDMDEIYGTPQKVTAGPRSLESVVPTLAKSQAEPTFPQLPGLGLNYDELQSSLEVEPPDFRVPEPLVPPLTSAAANQHFDKIDSRHERATYDNNVVMAAAEDEAIVESNATVYNNALHTENASLTIGQNAEDALQIDHDADASLPVQSDEVKLDSKLKQAKIGSQSLGEDVGSQTMLDNRSAHTGSSASCEGQKEVLQQSGNEQYIESDERSPAMEAEQAMDFAEAIVHTKLTFEGLAEPNKSNAEAEFELDSSPLESSSSDISSDTSSSDDSVADSDVDDYQMLSPAEQARRLMAEDGGSDDGQPGKRNGETHVVRTANEKPDEVVPKPDITVATDMKIEELGNVENLVENMAVIKAKTSGEYEVLETGSLLCLEDRSVIGVIAETLGRVQQPYYCVRFTNAAAMDEAGIRQDTKVFWVEKHSTTVFTQPLKAVKGTDASNLHDEEVGDDELEFSDDEAEAEHKRRVKLQKRPKHGGRDGPADGFSRRPQQRHQNRVNHGSHSHQEHKPSSADISLQYDDNDDMESKIEYGDDLYTPLARPSNLHDMIRRKPTLAESQTGRGNTNRGGCGGGRGDRQRHRRNRGTDRGDRFDRREHGGPQGNSRSRSRQYSPPKPQGNAFGAPPRNNLPPRPPSQSNDYGSYPSQGNGYQPQQPQMPPPSYWPQNSYPNFPSQHDNSYTQSYPQPQQNQTYYSQYPQSQPNSQYCQPQDSPPQSYQPHQSFLAHSQYPMQQAAYTSSSPENIHPGAHLSPAFFQQQAQLQPQPWQEPVSNATRRVQENLNF